MTNEEIRLISDYRIVIAGSTDLQTTLRPNCINPVSSQLPLFHQQTGIQILSLLI